MEVESSVDAKLLELASSLKTTSETSDTIPAEIIEEKITDEDISDLISKNYDRVLSNQDYLILVELDTKSIDVVALEYNVSVTYIKKLMRSNVGSEFLKQQAKQKSETALAIASISVAEGVMQYKKMIDDLFATGQTNLALSFLFGKASLAEVQNMLHKQQAEVVPDETNAMSNLFKNLLSDNIKK